MIEYKLFLGGTCAGTKWRDELIPLLNIKYFNPVVKEWSTECQDIEYVEKESICNIHLYVITKELQSVFSIAEAVESVRTCDKLCILHIIPDGFSKHELMSLEATRDIIINNGGISYVDSDIKRTAQLLELITI